MIFPATESIKTRLVLGIAALLPLVAPYQLLIKPVWTAIPGIAWLFAVAISLGAIAVSALLLAAAIFGLSREVVFDPTDKAIRVTESHLLRRKRRAEYAFDDVRQIEVISHDWSDGPTTFKLRMTPIAGRAFEFGDYSTRAEAESAHSSLVMLLEKLP